MKQMATGSFGFLTVLVLQWKAVYASQYMYVQNQN